MSGTLSEQDPERAQQEREKYLNAYNGTMVKIWLEKIAMMGIVDTGTLYKSVAGIHAHKLDDKVTSIELKQEFEYYGIFQDYGTGREVARGNSGDIGRDKVRRRRPWFSRKHYSSVMRIQEFWADNIGKEAALVLTDILQGGVSLRR